MDSKDQKILDASLALFLRHGYRKVTMSDIAQASEMSRPSLYASFSNKEGIFSALVARQQRRNGLATAERLPAASGLHAQLACLFDIWLIGPVMSVLGSENATDLIVNCQAWAPDATRAMHAEFEQALKTVLAPNLTGNPYITADDMAFILRTATTSLKASVENEPHLRRMVSGLIAMAVATVEKNGSEKK